MFCLLTSSFYPLFHYLFSESGQPLFGLPNSPVPLFWKLLFYPAPCYYIPLFRVTVDMAMFIHYPVAPPSPTTKLIGSGVDTWPNLAQAAALFPRNSKLNLKVKSLGWSLDWRWPGIHGWPCFLLFGLRKLVFREIKNDKTVTPIWELDLGTQRISGLCIPVCVCSAFLCDAFMLRQALSMKQKW